MCGTSPSDLGGYRGWASAENSKKTGPKISSQTAPRYPGPKRRQVFGTAPSGTEGTPSALGRTPGVLLKNPGCLLKDHWGLLKAPRSTGLGGCHPPKQPAKRGGAEGRHLPNPRGCGGRVL